jgi:two-component system CheB/CheR fusion protein
MLLFKNFRKPDNGPTRGEKLEAARCRLVEAASQDKIIAIVREAARGIFGADGVTFVLRDYSMCHYVEEDAISPLWKGQKFPMTSCISGWAMLNSQTAVITDIFTDPRIPQAVYRKTFVKSLIMVPIGLETKIAAMGAYWRDQRDFSDDDVQTVETMADHVGQALKRSAGLAA